MTRAAAASALVWLDDALDALRSAGLYRAPKTIEGPAGPEVAITGRRVLLFASNDYLGLANDPRVKEGAIRAVQRYGTGAGASRLVSAPATPSTATN